MRILTVVDSFPPTCGGAGWSTYEIVRELRARGHEIVLVQPRPRKREPPKALEYDGFRLRRFTSFAPPIPFVQNYFNNERLYAWFARELRHIIRDERIDIVHGQHRMGAPSAIGAAKAEGVPVVCDVRDYWPVCYWSDLIHDFDTAALCPACSPGMMTQCLKPRTGVLWPLTLPAIPYMTANLARKRAVMADADALMAVSTVIAGDLRARAPEMAGTRIEIIPNPVNVTSLDSEAAAPRPLDGPYAVYLGKLNRNKGIFHLIPAIQRTRLPWPLVVVGDGAESQALEETARAAGADIRITGWLPRHEALGWLRHARLLLFPSHGPESLSRVLIEAAALEVPIAAMDTGGTRDIISDEATGLLSRTPDEFAEDVARLAADPALARRLASAARAHVLRTFDTPLVVDKVEALYRDLLGGRTARHAVNVSAPFRQGAEGPL